MEQKNAYIRVENPPEEIVLTITQPRNRFGGAKLSPQEIRQLFYGVLDSQAQESIGAQVLDPEQTLTPDIFKQILREWEKNMPARFFHQLKGHNWLLTRARDSKGRTAAERRLGKQIISPDAHSGLYDITLERFRANVSKYNACEADLAEEIREQKIGLKYFSVVFVISIGISVGAYYSSDEDVHKWLGNVGGIFAVSSMVAVVGLAARLYCCNEVLRPITDAQQQFMEYYVAANYKQVAGPTLPQEKPLALISNMSPSAAPHLGAAAIKEEKLAETQPLLAGARPGSKALESRDRLFSSGAAKKTAKNPQASSYQAPLLKPLAAVFAGSGTGR